MMTAMTPTVRVLVVDDSALMRKLIPQIIQTDPSIEVVGTAMDGNFGLKKIADLKPQVVTLDLDMPGMNGIDTLKEIMRLHHLPVIVVSSHPQGAAITLKALSLGAFDFVGKPADASEHMPEVARELIAKIKAAALSRSVDLPSFPDAAAPSGGKAAPGTRVRPNKIIAIGVSTGGPQALQFLLSQLPVDFPGTIVVVQHMPENFTEMFARRLDECCAIGVRHAQSGDLLLAGRALICPGNQHIRVKRLPLGDVALLGDDPKVNGHRPSVDVLFESLAAEFGAEGVAVIMTGMGDDGAEAMGRVKSAGGMTIAQSEESCVVFGMPKAAIDRGFAVRIVALESLAKNLQGLCIGQRGKRNVGSLRAGAGHI